MPEPYVFLQVKIDPTVKSQAQLIARDLGLSLSDMVRLALNEIVRTKRLPSTTETKNPFTSCNW